MGLIAWLKKKITSAKNRGKKPVSSLHTEEDLIQWIARARNRLERFLITRSVRQGQVKKTKEWTLNKTNDGLFRLEGERYSLLLSTAPFLAEKDGKISGLLRMNESTLCRLLHDSAGIAQFLEKSDPLDTKYNDLAMALTGKELQEHELPVPMDMVTWSDFDVQSVLAHNSLNTIAHVMISSPPPVGHKILGVLSSRMKRSLILEMESLVSPGTDPALNPHSRNRALQDFESALLEFRRTMKEYLESETRKKELQEAREEKRVKSGI